MCAAIAVSSDVQDDVGLKNAASGAVLVVALFSGVIEVALISLRFLNVGAINYKIKYFLIAVSVKIIFFFFFFCHNEKVIKMQISSKSDTTPPP